MLEYLHKNPKDTRWVDRAISKGIIWRDPDTGAYTLCTEYIEELMEENLRLQIQSGEMEGYQWMKDGKPELGVREKRYYELKALYDNLVKEKEVDKNDNQEKKVDKNINHTVKEGDIDHIGYLLDWGDRKQMVIENMASKYVEHYPEKYRKLDEALKYIYNECGYIEYPEDEEEIDFCRSITK